MDDILDIHLNGPLMVTLFKLTYPCLYDTALNLIQSFIGQEVGEADWTHVMTSITMHYEAIQLDKLDIESKKLLPYIRQQIQSCGKPFVDINCVSEEFALFHRFITQEI